MKKETEQTFNKLVRDLIPDIIRAKGEEPEVVTLREDEFFWALGAKMLEEAMELNKAIIEGRREDIIGELADVKEVLLAILKIQNISEEELEEARINKNEKRGSFKKRIFLKKTKIVEDF